MKDPVVISPPIAAKTRFEIDFERNNEVIRVTLRFMHEMRMIPHVADKVTCDSCFNFSNQEEHTHATASFIETPVPT